MGEDGDERAWRIGTTLARVLFVVVAAALVYGGIRLAGLLDKGLDEVAERRTRDVEIVREQRKAGMEYIGNLTLEMAYVVPGQGDRRLQLEFTVKNNGDKPVLKAVALVSFGLKESNDRHEEKVILFDASDLSVRADRELFGGQERVMTRSVDLRDEWDLSNIRYGFKSVQIEVPGGKSSPRAEGEAPAEDTTEGDEAKPAAAE